MMRRVDSVKGDAFRSSPGHNAGMLTGDRVVLRGLERDHLPRIWELYNDIEVEHRASDQRPTPTSLAQLEARFDRRAAEPEAGIVRFVIEVDGDIVGECLLYGIDDYSRLSNLGISLRQDRWGKGVGQDAVRTLVRYAFDYLNLRKVSLEALADDPRAVGAYRKAGFAEEGRFRAHTWHGGRYADVVRMAVFRPGSEPGE
jgi:RimJ/RimL family protein N-acetyltransferase